jgi:hypothetical protein
LLFVIKSFFPLRIKMATPSVVNAEVLQLTELGGHMTPLPLAAALIPRIEALNEILMASSVPHPNEFVTADCQAQIEP